MYKCQFNIKLLSQFKTLTLVQNMKALVYSNVIHIRNTILLLVNRTKQILARNLHAKIDHFTLQTFNNQHNIIKTHTNLARLLEPEYMEPT